MKRLSVLIGSSLLLGCALAGETLPRAVFSETENESAAAMLSVVFYCERGEWPSSIAELEKFVADEALAAPDWRALEGARMTTSDSGDLQIGVQRTLREDSELGNPDRPVEINFTIGVPEKCEQAADRSKRSSHAYSVAAPYQV